MAKALQATPPKVVSSATGISVVVPKRQKPVDPRAIKVRATSKGFYGRPIESLRQPDDVFLMFVRDLQPYVKGRMAGDPVRELEVVDIQGVKYNLPSWVVDAAKPIDEVEFDEPVDDEDESTANETEELLEGDG